MTQNIYESPLVTVICITYNHEKYIAEAIESFVRQKTNFNLEVLVHDDCSTDRTAQIIKEYEKKYPGIVKGYFEEENQYSKGISPTLLMFSQASGKYIALCEGDDFWIDENKLQMQVDYMQKDEECSLCFHASKVINAKDGSFMNSMRLNNIDGIVPCEKIILNRNKFSTASMLFCKKYIEEYPRQLGCYDYVLKLYLASKGHTYYINKEMSVYRKNVPNSWSVKSRNDAERQCEFLDNAIEVFKKFNEFTSKKFDKEISYVIRTRIYRKHFLKKEYQTLIKDYKDLLEKEPLRVKLFVLLSAKHPNLAKNMHQLYKLLRKIRNNRKSRKK